MGTSSLSKLFKKEAKVAVPRTGWLLPWTATTAVVLCILLLSMQFWHLSVFGSAIDYNHAGNWADMTSSIASALAVIVAVSSFAVEQRRATDERRAARIQELTSVYCWLEWGLRGSRDAWLLKFQNETKVPILRWKISVAGDTALKFTSSGYGPIRPGASELLVEELSGVTPERQPGVDFSFMDPSGVYWRRSANEAALTPLHTLEIT